MTRHAPDGRLAYVDCVNGAAGDMIVGALLDAGADRAQLVSGLESLGLSGYRLDIATVARAGITGTHFHVELDSRETQPHRHLKTIASIIEGAPLSDNVRRRSMLAFERLADAEGAVHGTSREKVHFHEVGAVDAILDIVGAMLAIELLDIGRVICSPVPVGSGTVECAHGVMPVPAPATARLLVGVPIAATDETGELTTPTGAAILTALAESFGAMPAMTVRSVGYGAGSREAKRRPNMLRVFVGDGVAPTAAGTDRVVQLETNLDDVSGQIAGHCMERLLAAGALDVFASPIQMKKWRPGIVLTALCPPELAGECERIIFRETGTLGVRRQDVARTTLPRRAESVTTAFGAIRMKVAEADGGVIARPEFDDCKKAALERGVPLRDVIDAAEAAWRASDPRTDSTRR